MISRFLHMGAGATWPGEMALRLNPHILSDLAGNLKNGVIIVAGTNGKTTTALMIKTILEAQGMSVVHNASGANLENGIVSALIQHNNADWGVFEVDENSLPAIMEQCHSGLRAGIQSFSDGSRVKPGMTKSVIIVLLNLFRDQLDRYGEVDVIAEKWAEALRAQYEQHEQESKTGKMNIIQIVANADDPLIAFIGKVVASRPGLEASVKYFGLNDSKQFQNKMEHATDSIFCLNCGGRLTYEGVYYSHIGIWHCIKCKEKRPTPDISDWKSPLSGLYNQYNTLAAVSVAQVLGFEADLSKFSPAFGRQEGIGNIKIFLSKNPAGFNQSLRTVLELGAKHILLILNDRIPDGRDVSWIWDVDFEMIPKHVSVRASGDRVHDLALRLKYAGIKTKIIENLHEALKTKEPLFVLPTYSAMLEVRNILKGRKIL